MWLITTLLAAIAVTVILFVFPKNKLRLEVLTIMLWGLGIMILVDHILGYEGGMFLEMETDGLISNGVVLGLLMLLPVLAIWGIFVGISNRKKNMLKG